ncbi:MAG: hypothetical protein ACTSRR_12670 [Candidatus Heimdallarchaeaceae archaeon]
MQEVEQLRSHLDRIKESIDNLSNEEINVIPGFFEELEKKENELNEEIKKLKEDLQNLVDNIQKTEEEISLNEAELQKLKEKEDIKREEKDKIISEISELKDKNILLDTQIEEKSIELETLTEQYSQVQINSKQQIEELTAKISALEEELKKAKEDNKLIVYLMDAGLMDVPEAEIISVIAASTDGLTLSEIKEKVSIPSVRVQPTLNNLLEKVLTYDARREKYQISTIVQEEMNNRS